MALLSEIVLKKIDEAFLKKAAVYFQRMRGYTGSVDKPFLGVVDKNTGTITSPGGKQYQGLVLGDPSRRIDGAVPLNSTTAVIVEEDYLQDYIEGGEEIVGIGRFDSLLEGQEPKNLPVIWEETTGNLFFVPTDEWPKSKLIQPSSATFHEIRNSLTLLPSGKYVTTIDAEKYEVSTDYRAVLSINYIMEDPVAVFSDSGSDLLLWSVFYPVSWNEETVTTPVEKELMRGDLLPIEVFWTIFKEVSFSDEEEKLTIDGVSLPKISYTEAESGSVLLEGSFMEELVPRGVPISGAVGHFLNADGEPLLAKPAELPNTFTNSFLLGLTDEGKITAVWTHRKDLADASVVSGVFGVYVPGCTDPPKCVNVGWATSGVPKNVNLVFGAGSVFLDFVNLIYFDEFTSVDVLTFDNFEKLAPLSINRVFSRREKEQFAWESLSLTGTCNDNVQINCTSYVPSKQTTITAESEFLQNTRTPSTNVALQFSPYDNGKKLPSLLFAFGTLETETTPFMPTAYTLNYVDKGPPKVTQLYKAASDKAESAVITALSGKAAIYHLHTNADVPYDTILLPDPSDLGSFIEVPIEKVRFTWQPSSEDFLVLEQLEKKSAKKQLKYVFSRWSIKDEVFGVFQGSDVKFNINRDPAQEKEFGSNLSYYSLSVGQPSIILIDVIPPSASAQQITMQSYRVRTL